MSHEVAVLETREVTISSEQKELIRKTICKDATDAEMQLFFFDCQRRGTHPLDKLIHFTKRSGKYTPITSIDFFRLRAHGSGVYAGEDEPVYTTITSGAVDTCKYTVYRLVKGTRCPWTATARWDEYYPGDPLGFMWKKMPFLMLAKCAEALALRKAFPAELQGLYVKEEMDQAGLPPRLKTGAEMLAELDAKDKAAEDGAKDAGEQSHEAAITQQVRDAPLPPADIFQQSSAIADHETALDEAKTDAELKQAWEDCTKDGRLTSETRAPLYKKFMKLAGALKGKK